MVRPRRTRLYDTAYKVGESYYKPALDDLDRRRYGRAASPVRHTPSRIKFDLDSKLDEELNAVRARAHRAITDEPSYFDSRGQRVARSQYHQLANAAAYVDNDDELGEESSLSRIRASRQKMTSLMNDLDLDDSFSTIKRRSNIDLGDKLMNISANDDYGLKSRGIKLVTGIDEVDTEFEPEFKGRTRKLLNRLTDDTSNGELDSTRRSVLQSIRKTVVSSTDDSSSSAIDSAASFRAKQTKARLADLETDIQNRQERIMNAEARSARLKNFMAENDIDTVSKKDILSSESLAF